MKKLILSALMTILFNFIYAQDKDFKESDVIEVKLNKKQIHSNAKDWIVKTFGDYKSVLQFEDDDKIIIKGYSDLDAKIRDISVSDLHTIDTKVYYTLTIESKENKFRYKLDDIYIIEDEYINGFRPVKLLNNIDYYKKMKVSLVNNVDKVNSIDFASLKKSEQKDLKKKNDSDMKTLSFTNKIIESYNYKINSLIQSLKDNMNTSDEW